MRPLKIFFSCSGVGILDRGIETFFREAFDGLRGTDGLEITLYKGAGEEKPDEHVLWNVPRTGRIARLLGACIRRNSYVAEQLSTFPSMVRAIRKHRPDIIFYSDSNLGFQLFRWRKQIGVPFRLLFSNGGPCGPPFDRTDYVHQVAPIYYEEAIAAGEPEDRHRMVPYGINVPAGAPDVSEEAKRRTRRQLGLPTDRQIVLSVGWISATQKRMDYLVRELAALRVARRSKIEDAPLSRRRSEIEDRSSPLTSNSHLPTAPANGGNSLTSNSDLRSPFLVLLGAMDESSNAIVDLARGRLGEENFTARSVPHDQVADYYRAADLFALASLQEGFGRVFLEALIYGLPVIAHDHPVMRFVLGDEGIFGDLSKEGALAELISEKLAVRSQESGVRSQGAAIERREYVRRRFSWEVLRPQYREMFFACARIAQRS
jgi:1,2-diacylglycerol 3-alpha-glucosyltransferase